MGYCGMSVPLGDTYTYEEAKGRMRARIEWFEEAIGGAVVKLRPPSFNAVEFCEPETCHMVPDACGITYIRKMKER